MPLVIWKWSHLGSDNQPEGDINNWDQIRLAFVPSLVKSAALAGETVRRYPTAQNLWVEEVYTCEANGTVKVKIQDSGAQRAHEYRLGRWAKRAKERVGGPPCEKVE
ncbi:MAG: hypothetical protein WBQ61_00825 [Candidatus Acidiferrum sp.]